VNVPQKVRIFAWRLAQDGLATQLNRRHRKPEESGRCQVCGAEDESGHHVVISCMRAASLWREMRNHWSLPPEHMFMQDSHEWLLMLLSLVNKDSKARILLLLWHSWHLRNDVIHGRGLATVKGFVELLSSHATSLNIISGIRGQEPSAKGKEVVWKGAISTSMPHVDQEVQEPQCWCPPLEGWVKLNTDVGFCQHTGQASIGIIVWDSHGSVLLSAWRSIRHGGGADQAEAEACLQGICLVVEWIKQPVCVESDCATLIQAINRKEADHSRWAGIIKEIQATGNQLPGCLFSHIKREANQVAHELSQRELRREQVVVMRFWVPPNLCLHVEKEMLASREGTPHVMWFLRNGIEVSCHKKNARSCHCQVKRSGSAIQSHNWVAKHFVGYEIWQIICCVCR
jgi:hypothetical protein